MSERSVGLIILTEIPEIGLCAVLRERGYFNFEKMQPESWPGACQVTVHGKLERDEDFYTAIYREIREELGGDFAFYLPFFLPFKDSRIIEILRFQKKDKEVFTFAVKVDSGLLKKIRLGPESGVIRFMQKHEVTSIVDISNFNKAEGVSDRKTIAMFPYEKEAVAKAFALFS